jgi:hypothetical protein
MLETMEVTPPMMSTFNKVPTMIITEVKHTCGECREGTGVVKGEVVRGGG